MEARQAFVALRAILYGTGFVLLWTWLALASRRYDTALAVAWPAWLHPVGLAVAGAGALLAASCIAVFVSRGRGTPAPFDAPRVFVASGPYRYVRNPMYVGALAVLLGSGLASDSPSILLLALLFGLLMHGFVVLYEEPALDRRFGASYRDFTAQVNRWWPRAPRARPAPSSSAGS